MVVNPDLDLSILGFPFTLAPVKRLVSKAVAKQGTGRFGVGGDRRSLTLHERDEELIRAVTEANPRTVVVVIGGSAIIMEAWCASVPVILMAWYPGMEGGRAIADILTGAAEPGGRLPLAIPTSADHLPFFDPDTTTITYDSWWGQRKLDRDGNPAAFPFGFGLGYTTFDLELVSEDRSGGMARVRVRNTGPRAGSTVVQLYAVPDDAVLVPVLLGFQRVELPSGAEAVVDVDLDLTPTLERDPATKSWGPRPDKWHLVAALDSAAACRGPACAR
jgi:beta-glucosidase